MGNLRRNRIAIKIGAHKEYDTCRFCGKDALTPFISFGNVPLAGGFLPSNKKSVLAREQLFPLTIVFCRSCGLVQVKEVIEAKTLFADYFYRSSAIGTLVTHFQDYASRLTKLFPDTTNSFVVEIGSNDGVLLKPLRAKGFRVLGVDPAENIVASLSQKETPTLCACFGERTAKDVKKRYGMADCIATSNSFAHIDDMHDVMRGIKLLLKPDGALIIENHYLGTLIKEFQYDMMYHEHQSYYSLFSLEKFFSLYQMEVFNVRKIPIHGGSMHFEVQHMGTGKREISASVLELREEEKIQGLGKLSTFKSFSDDIAKQASQLMSLLNKLSSEGKRVVGYGASGRATILMSYCGIDVTHIDCVVDDAPAKQGAFTPGNHLPIYTSQVLLGNNAPDYCLLFAWSFADEIIKRNPEYIKQGGKFIVPLPSVKIVP